VAAPAPGPVVTTPTTRLRAERDDEHDLLECWRGESASEFEDWSGDPPAGFERGVRLSAPAGGGDLVVTDGHDRPIGTVSWHPMLYGPSPGSQAFDIGISLRPEARGRGHGGRAQQLLAEYLFATTPVHRVQASTDVANVAEQRALERAGFTREGVLRGAQWRLGRYHDMVSYARLRTDA
jgi:RimJ/RimL family protein N-acetyltransferase